MTARDERALAGWTTDSAEAFLRSRVAVLNGADAEHLMLEELDRLRAQLDLERERTRKAEARALKAENLYVALKSKRKVQP